MEVHSFVGMQRNTRCINQISGPPFNNFVEPLTFSVPAALLLSLFTQTSPAPSSHFNGVLMVPQEEGLCVICAGQMRSGIPPCLHFYVDPSLKVIQTTQNG